MNLLSFLLLICLGIANGWKFHSLANQLLNRNWKRLSVTTGIVFQSLLPIYTLPVSAEEVTKQDFVTYKNDQFRYSFEYPKDWKENDVPISRQEKIKVFIDPNDKDTSVTVFTKFIPADFTSLGSFGGSDAIRLFILPRNDQIETKIIQEKSKGNLYGIEYTVTSPNDPVRHIYNSFALQPQESLISLLVQTPEDHFKSNEKIFHQIIDSFLLWKQLN
eukprot:gene805-858_t